MEYVQHRSWFNDNVSSFKRTSWEIIHGMKLFLHFSDSREVWLKFTRIQINSPGRKLFRIRDSDVKENKTIPTRQVQRKFQSEQHQQSLQGIHPKIPPFHFQQCSESFWIRKFPKLNYFSASKSLLTSTDASLLNLNVMKLKLFCCLGDLMQLNFELKLRRRSLNCWKRLWFRARV